VDDEIRGRIRAGCKEYLTTRQKMAENKAREQERSDGFGNVAVAAVKYTCFLLEALDGGKENKLPEDYLMEGVTGYFVQDTHTDAGLFLAFVPKLTNRGKAAEQNRLNQAHRLLKTCLSEAEEKAFHWDTFRRQFRFFQKLFVAYVIRMQFKRVTIDECREYIWEQVQGKISRNNLGDYMKWFASCDVIPFQVSTLHVFMVLTDASRYLTSMLLIWNMQVEISWSTFLVIMSTMRRPRLRSTKPHWFMWRMLLLLTNG